MPSVAGVRRWAKDKVHKAQELLDDSNIGQEVKTVFFDGSSHSKPTSPPSQPPPIPSQPQTLPQNPPVTPAIPSSGSVPQPPANNVTFDGGEYLVAGVGGFKNKKEFTFNSTILPEGLYASDYTVYDIDNGSPYNHRFDPANVYSDGEFLNLKVPGAQDLSPGCTISCAEIATTADNIKYASVRMNIIFSDVPGTCHGLFFYLDDTQECDIEYLTDPKSLSNIVDGRVATSNTSIPLWMSNQAVKVGQQPTQATASAPQDVTAIHEYRIDWVKDYTAFYVDGKLLNKYTTNVPTKAGSWMWNNWSNGDQGWSVGPPAKDNVMRIQKIIMYYNTTSDA